MQKQAVEEIIRKLLVIQERDGHIARAQKELNEIPNRREDIERNIAQANANVEQAREKIKTRQAAVRQVELEIDTHRQHIAKLREQQFQIKSNEEFRTLNKEIAGIQDTIRSLEDKELELMEQVELAKKEENAGKAALAQVEGEIKQEQQRLSDRSKNLETELEQTRRERADLATTIDPEWLARYNLVIENKKDGALLAVENGTCGGCHMKLPPHVINEARKSEAIVSCNFCGRMLYWAP